MSIRSKLGRASAGLVMAMALVACGDDSDDEAADVPAQPATTVTTFTTTPTTAPAPEAVPTGAVAAGGGGTAVGSR